MWFGPMLCKFKEKYNCIVLNPKKSARNFRVIRSLHAVLSLFCTESMSFQYLNYSVCAVHCCECYINYLRHLGDLGQLSNSSDNNAEEQILR